MLKIETSYTKKDGTVCQLKTPKMKLLGKFMDNDETRSFTVLGKNGVQKFEANERSKFDRYSVFVKDYKDEATDGGYFLELGIQSYGALMDLHLEQFMSFKVTKDFVEDKKTGALRPVVVALLIDEDSSSLNSTPTIKLTPTPKVEVKIELPSKLDKMTEYEIALHNTLKEQLNAMNISEEDKFNAYKRNFIRSKEEGKDIQEVTDARLRSMYE